MGRMNSEFEIMGDIRPSSFQASGMLQTCLNEVSVLSADIFGQDCIELMTAKEQLHYRLTILVKHTERQKSVDSLDEDPQNIQAGSSLVGFVLYRFEPALGRLTIDRLAVRQEFRRQGHGEKLVQWCARQKGASFVALAAYPTALRFYRSLGFRHVKTWSEGGKTRPSTVLAEGQIYMELRPTKGKGRLQKCQ